MTKHDATEQAFKNGYKQGMEDAMKASDSNQIFIFCKIEQLALEQIRFDAFIADYTDDGR